MNRMAKIWWRIVYNKRPEMYATKKGVVMGVGNSFVDHPRFASEPYLVRFGDNNRVSFGVSFLTHDGGRWVLDNLYPDENPFLKFGTIVIGSNNFIGANSIINPNVKIGDNCIVAAGSVVTKDIPSGEVWGGVPARFIMHTETYYEKMRSNPISKQIDFDRLMDNKEKELKRVFGIEQ